ncbi:hypothetical protein Tco_1051421, partial [Tanacetum coccineum]
MTFPFINLEDDERVEETLTDSEHGEYTIKVLPLQVQKAKPPSQRNFVIHQRGPRYPYIPYLSRMNQEKQKEKDEKLPEKLGDPGKFLIPCGFSELKCKALADLGIARDVFVPVGKFTFPADFVIVNYEGDSLILNMRNDTSSYSNEPRQESINMIDVYNVSHEEIREDLFVTNHQSGNPTSISELETKSSSSSPILISLEESELIWEEFEAYLAIDSFPPGNCNPLSLLPHFHNSLSSSTTSSSPSLHISDTIDYFLEKFADELAHITFLPENDDLPFDAESDLLELVYLLNHDP